MLWTLVQPSRGRLRQQSSQHVKIYGSQFRKSRNAIRVLPPNRRLAIILRSNINRTVQPFVDDDVDRLGSVFHGHWRDRGLRWGGLFGSDPAAFHTSGSFVRAALSIK